MRKEIKEEDDDPTHFLPAPKKGKVRPIILKSKDTKQEVEFSEMKRK